MLPLKSTTTDFSNAEGLDDDFPDFGFDFSKPEGFESTDGSIAEGFESAGTLAGDSKPSALKIPPPGNANGLQSSGLGSRIDPTRKPRKELSVEENNAGSVASLDEFEDSNEAYEDMYFDPSDLKSHVVMLLLDKAAVHR